MTAVPRLGLSNADSAWPSVRWEHAVDIDARPICVLNSIIGDGPEANRLRDLLDSSHLVWTAELRCPSTAFSYTEFSSESEMTVDLSSFDHSALSRDRFLICGLATAKPFQLNTQGALPIFEPTIDIPKGTWLCSYQPVYEISHPIRSLLVWKARNDLDEGRLSVRPTGALRYDALVPPDLFHEIVNLRCRPDIWIAALIAALSLIFIAKLRRVSQRSKRMKMRNHQKLSPTSRDMIYLWVMHSMQPKPPPISFRSTSHSCPLMRWRMIRCEHGNG